MHFFKKCLTLWSDVWSLRLSFNFDIDDEVESEEFVYNKSFTGTSNNEVDYISYPCYFRGFMLQRFAKPSRESPDSKGIPLLPR